MDVALVALLIVLAFVAGCVVGGLWVMNVMMDALDDALEYELLAESEGTE